MDKGLFEPIKALLLSIPECGNLEISHSSLTDDESWKEFALTAVSPLTAPELRL